MGGTRARGDAPSARLAAARAWEGPVENAPASHNGAAKFWVDIPFSEAVDLSFKAFKDNELLTFTGGALRNQRRLAGSRNVWQIEVKPLGNVDVIAWFPQALLYGFWQSHLGKKRQNTKHARAWVSEIIGWQPGSTETRALGLKGDVLNLNTDDVVTTNPDDRTAWEVGKGARIAGAKSDKLSELGHGQVPFMQNDAPAAARLAPAGNE